MVADGIDDTEKLSFVWQLVDLAKNLRQERLFVISEQTHLQQLNTNVSKQWFDLTKLLWITWQQRICVNKLSVSHYDYSPSSCSGSITSLDKAVFEDAHKILTYQANLHCTQLLNYIKSRPQLLAQCLSVVNQTQSEFLVAVVESVIAGLYGCCLVPEDEASVLELLLHLTHFQLVTSEDPLRLLRHGSCAFARLYSLYHEGLYSATMFLTAALYSPIRHLLMEDEKFLDIEPDKVLLRMTTAERVKMFGSEDTPDYKDNLQKHRLWTVNKVVSITNKFIESIRTHMHCFPDSICWLVRHIYRSLMNAHQLREKQVFALCVDLVITSFICPAIVDPESYGILDAPISYIARFNLIQVAKILQMLAMRKYEPIDPKVADLFKHFDEDCLSPIINILLEDALQKDEFDKDPSILDSNDQLKQMNRNARAFFTEQQLHNLIIFLQGASNNHMIPKKEKVRLEELITNVVNDLSTVPANEPSSSKNSNLTESISPVTIARKQINIISKAVSKTKISAVAVASSVLSGGNETDFENHSNIPVQISSNKDLEVVLVFNLEEENEIGILELLTEEQVLSDEKCGIGDNNVCDTLLNVNSCVEGPSSQTKTISTCCSSQDGEEVVSEAGSNQSEDSSIDIEAEDQNDNLSDMISANVSGRGTPNISGRDTPSSQIMENENEEAGNAEVPVIPPTAPQVKQPRFDLDDKFGKFEIKNLPHGGDETVSLVSDTWSTDVLASDSENIEQNQSANSASIAAVFSSSDALAMFQNANFPQLIDISETASEGWSTDVVVSDSDRVTEVDTDDTASVARSDITTRSEMESRGESVDPSNEDCPATPSTTSSQGGQKKESFSLMHVIDNGDELPTSSTGSTIDQRRNMSTGQLLSSSMSQPRSSFNRQISVDSEDVRATSGDVGNVSMSSATSVSSSSSSTGVNESENTQKSSMYTEQVSITSTQLNTSFVSTTATSSATAILASPHSTSNGNALQPNEKSTRSSTIIKSISFDKTAEKGDKDEERSKQRSSFFKNFKLAFKNRRGRENASQWGASTSGSLVVQYNKDIREQEANSRVKISRSESSTRTKTFNSSSLPRDASTSEDILAKYRTKQNANTVILLENTPVNDANVQLEQDIASDEINIHCETFKFENAKKKLRYVLSNAEIQQLPCAKNVPRNLKGMWCQQQNILVAFLQLQLAEAIHLNDRSLVAYLHETLRCIRAFDDQKCIYLLESLKKEHKNRAPYLAYLMRCRQTLLSINSHLTRLFKRVRCEQDVCKNFFASICVRLFLQSREQQLLQFATEFTNAKLSDEKNDVLRNFVGFLERQIDTDSTWHGVSQEQLESIKIAVEKSVISRVYMHAMFPNSDGDVSRDEVLQKHIKKLSKVITPNHKDLCIPKKYHYECPWPTAQEEIISMSAFKTPTEKLGCILRCTQAIQNLLCLACNNSVPSADNLVPVLVYVIIMANPPSLLSTIQYINSFYGTRLQGEEHYWWVQFCSAVEYIKTMDYTC